MRFKTPITPNFRMSAAWLISICLLMGNAYAQNPIQEALVGCDKEIKQFCSQVTPGDGRLVHCARAHVDKLSDQCKGSVNRANYQLQQMDVVFKYVTLQCAVDAVKLCPEVEIGGQRIIECLKENRSEINKFCETALADVGAYK